MIDFVLIKVLKILAIVSLLCINFSDEALAKSPSKDLKDVLAVSMPEAFFEVYRSKHNGYKDSLHMSGSRRNALVIGTNARPDDLTLVVWLHGLGGFTKKTFKRVMTQIEEVNAKNHSIAVVIPEMPWSSSTKTPRGRQGKVWRNNSQFKNFLDEANGKLRVWSQRSFRKPLGTISVIVVGHSAGGSAIMSASIEGSLCDERVNNIIWSDASYGSWLSRAHTGCMKNDRIQKDIVVREWDKPHTNAKSFFKKTSASSYNFKVVSRKKYTHGEIGNNIFSITSLFPPGC